MNPIQPSSADSNRILDAHGGKITFAAIFAALFPLIFFGIDVTDTGFHLYYQERAIADRDFVHSDWWLSDLLGGAWLVLTDRYGLIGARLGGVLLVALSGALSVLTAKRFLGRMEWALPIAAFALSFLAKPQLLFPHYYTIPMLLSVAFALLYSELIVRIEDGRSAGHIAALCGLSLAMLMFSRVPAAIAILIPILTLLLCLRYRRVHFRQALRLNLVALGVFATCFLLTSVIGLGEPALPEPPTAPSRSKIGVSIYDLVDTIALQIWTFTPYLAALFASLALLTRFSTVRPMIILGIFLLLVGYGCVAVLQTSLRLEAVPFVLSKSGPIAWTVSNYFLLLLALCDLIAFAVLCRESSWSQRYPLTVMLIMGLVLPVAVGGGSHAGLGKLRCGMWLLGLALPVLLSALSQLPAYRPYRRELRLAPLLLFSIIGVTGMIRAYTAVYPETSNNLLEYQYVMKAGRLAGTRTTMLRLGKNLDELVVAVRERSDPGATILAYDNLTTVYYATRTRAYKHFVWPSLYTREYLEFALSSICKDETPELIVRTRTRSRVSNAKRKSARRLDGAQLMDHLIERNCRPDRIWSNELFEILKATSVQPIPAIPKSP